MQDGCRSKLSCSAKLSRAQTSPPRCTESSPSHTNGWRLKTLQARTDRQLKWNASAIRQFVTRHPRRNVPDSHVLRAKYHLNTVAEHISYAQKKRDLDTAENRFVKFALQDFRAFASRSTEVFESESGWEAAAGICRRLSGILDDW